METQDPVTCTICLKPTDDGITHLGHVICEQCETRIDEYEDKRESRIEYIHERAEKKLAEYQVKHDRAHQMADSIPFGQPIHIGHHSEQRDRNFRNRIHTTFKGAFEAYDTHKHYVRKATAAENNDAVYIEDPAAIIKLKIKIEQMEADHARMIAENKIMRKAAKKYPNDIEMQASYCVQEGMNAELATELLTPDYMGRIGYKSYSLSSSRNGIKRLQKRMAEIRAHVDKLVDPVTTEPDVYTGIGLTVIRDVEDNRIRLCFMNKPPESVRKNLKSRGYRWSPRNKAWQRHLNTFNAGYHLDPVLKIMRELTTDKTPDAVIKRETAKVGEPQYQTGEPINIDDIIIFEYGTRYTKTVKAVAVVEQIDIRFGKFWVVFWMQNFTMRGTYYYASEAHKVELFTGTITEAIQKTTLANMQTQLGDHDEPDGTGSHMIENQRGTPIGGCWFASVVKITEKYTHGQMVTVGNLTRRCNKFTINGTDFITWDNVASRNKGDAK